MRSFFPVFLAGMLAVPAFAQDGKTNAQPDLKTTAQAPGITILVTAGVVSAPFVLTNGYLHQPGLQTEVSEGGKAVFDFTITNAGDYVIHAVVNAPAEDSNSFFLNIDAKPEDPLTIWDIDVTSGFEERVVSWRGDGAADSDQFAPKRFKLAPGKHQLFIYGREPDAQLKSLTLRPVKAE